MPTRRPSRPRYFSRAPSRFCFFLSLYLSVPAYALGTAGCYRAELNESRRNSFLRGLPSCRLPLTFLAGDHGECLWRIMTAQGQQWTQRASRLRVVFRQSFTRSSCASSAPLAPAVAAIVIYSRRLNARNIIAFFFFSVFSPLFWSIPPRARSESPFRAMCTRCGI